MTAQEMLDKYGFKFISQDHRDRMELAMNEYALHVAKQAVDEEKKRAGNSCRNAWDFRRTICRLDSVLSRIKELTK